MPHEKVVGLQETALCTLEEVRTFANEPMSELIEEVSAAIKNDLSQVDSRLTGCDKYLSDEIDSLKSNTYRKKETSSETEIAEALSELSSSLYSRISAELNNTYVPGTRTNPAYLMSDTSSKTELDAAFAKKQDVVAIAD